MWPFQVTIAQRIHSTQCEMAARVMCARKKPDESPADFARRRNTAAGRFIAKDWWDVRYRNAVINWDAHLARPRNAATWPARLQSCQDADWLGFRRAVFSSGAVQRIRARILRGRVQRRWDEGVKVAADWSP